jgi:predicted phage tail protein
MFIPGMQGAGITLFKVGVTLASATISAIGSSLYAYGSKLDAIQKMEKMFAEMAAQQKGKGAGGGTKLTGGKGKSYALGADLNLASQGSMVSIGYGKMKMGSNVIAASIKNNPTNVDFEQNAISTSNNALSLYD